jgi:hypothetical protein
MSRLAAVLLFCLAGAFAGSPAVAQDAASPAIRSVIQDQLGAFTKDDAAGAFGYASPGIQRMFGTPEIFMDMVRQGYPPVHRPQGYTFGTLRLEPDGPVQEVIITDAAGTQWLALYSMELQPDGTWKISGCSLVKAPPNTA